jgi:hypothetical protein
MLRTLTAAFVLMGVTTSVATAASIHVDGVLHQRGTSMRFVLVRVGDNATGYLDAVYSR